MSQKQDAVLYRRNSPHTTDDGLKYFYRKHMGRNISVKGNVFTKTMTSGYDCVIKFPFNENVNAYTIEIKRSKYSGAGVFIGLVSGSKEIMGSPWANRVASTLIDKENTGKFYGIGTKNNSEQTIKRILEVSEDGYCIDGSSYKFVLNEKKDKFQIYMDGKFYGNSQNPSSFKRPHVLAVFLYFQDNSVKVTAHKEKGIGVLNKVVTHEFQRKRVFEETPWSKNPTVIDPKERKAFQDDFNAISLEAKKCLEFYFEMEKNLKGKLETKRVMKEVDSLASNKPSSKKGSQFGLSLFDTYSHTSGALQNIKSVYTEVTGKIAALKQDVSAVVKFFGTLMLVIDKLEFFFKSITLTEEGMSSKQFQELNLTMNQLELDMDRCKMSKDSIARFYNFYGKIVGKVMKSKASILLFNTIKRKLVLFKEREYKRKSLAATVDSKKFNEYVKLTLDNNEIITKVVAIFPKIKELEKIFFTSILGKSFKSSSISLDIHDLRKMIDVMGKIEVKIKKLKITVKKYTEKNRTENLALVNGIIPLKKKIDASRFQFYKRKIEFLLKSGGIHLEVLKQTLVITAAKNIVELIKDSDPMLQIPLKPRIKAPEETFVVVATWEKRLVYLLQKESERKSAVSNNIVVTPTVEQQPFDFQHFKFLEIPRNKILYCKEKGKKVCLGVGGFGEVRKVELQCFPKKICALKVVKFEGSLELIEDAIKKEVFTVKYLTHPGILTVFGYVRFSDYKIGIVMECMEGGNLFKLIEKNKGKISNFDKFYLTKRMVDACLYLHEEKGIIHRDIKPQNWLLTSDKKIIKLGDFGLIKTRTSSSATKGAGVTGTFRYIANELYDDEYTYSFASDIFALGMTLYYLYVEKEAFYEVKNEPMAATKIMHKLNDGKKPTFPDSCPKEFVEIVEMCIDDVKKRPTARKLLVHLCSVEKKFTKVNLPSNVVPIKERKCQFCYKKRYCYLSECCKKFFCQDCILKKIEKNNSIEVKCLSKVCKTRISREWIVSTKNAKLTEKLWKMDLKEKFNACGNCGNLFRRIDSVVNKMKCSICKIDICRFCFKKWEGKSGLCTNEECELFDDPLESLNVKPEMIPFKFTKEEEPRMIFRARLCPWCGTPVFRKRKSEHCKHMECSCGDSFCFVCLGKKKGKMHDETVKSWHDVDGGDPWGYCGLAIKQTEVPKSLKK